MNRRQFLLSSSAAMVANAAGVPEWPGAFRMRLVSYLEQHRRAPGAYGWSSDVTPQVTPTFGVVGCYTILGFKFPDARRTASFVREHYPVPERRRTERPLWRLDFEQVQTLLWLGESIESFRSLASSWTKPAEFTSRYELGANPVLQHQAMAVRVRHLLKLSPSEADARWREYFQARRRPDGTFNVTPASDGSPGHVMNTLWGLLGSESVGLQLEAAPKLADWVNACQLDSGGFTYAPDATIGAVDDVAYTWCALQILERLQTKAAGASQCAEWVESLQTAEGGFQDRPGGEPNPLATYYALDCLRMLGHTPREAPARASRAPRHAIAPGSDVFTMQVEAPGSGSPREAVLLAKTLGIHLWTAKNCPEGWIAEAQSVADEQKVPVRFGIGDEEYGTYVAVPGLGCYSHLVDLVAPFETDTGAPMPKKNHPYPWEEFRDTRAAALRRGGGRLVWQFLENEELTRALLDEATQSKTYSAIASFHFGNENFLHSQPFLHRWYGRLPFVGLQDAHGSESWWWGNQLTGFRTLFIAKEPTWEGWLEALDKNHVMTVRRDAVTNWQMHLAGGMEQVREFVRKRESQWRWWDASNAQARRPPASLIVLRPGMRYEVGAPKSGMALRVRLWAENSGQGVPLEPQVELAELRVDGAVAQPRLVESKQDRYYLLEIPDRAGAHVAEAAIRLRRTGNVVKVKQEWRT